MKKLYVGVYGVGLGHASRMVNLVSKLNELEVRFSSFGDAVDYIKRYGYHCFYVPPIELSWDDSIGFSIKRSITNIPFNMANFVRQCMKELRIIGEFDPDLVISDTRLSTTLIARSYNIRTITILNQIRLLLSNRLREFKITRLFEDMLGEFLGSLWSMSNELLVPDLPPPYTISEANLWNIRSVSKKLKYIGFIVPKPKIDNYTKENIYKMLNLSNKPLIFIHISGPTKTKIGVLRYIITALKDRRDIELVVSEGNPKGNIEPKRINNGWYYEWCPIKDELFSISDFLIIRGGHSTISQAIIYGKPFISLPIENHGEQISNANKINKLGIGIMLRDINKINEYIDFLLNNREEYERNILRIKEIADKLDGIDRLRCIVEEYLSR